MTKNQMPSASGVRIAGDKYQRLQAWRCCLDALHEHHTGKGQNPIVAVGVEEAGVGNADDVVLYRANPPHTYMQVKYAADHRTALNIEYLDTSGVLAGLRKVHAELAAAGIASQMRLVTNRTIDPSDVLLADLDGRDGSLLPRAAQQGPTSNRGKARAAWARAAKTDVKGLLGFLHEFRIEISHDIGRLREEISLRMTANGLKSDDGSIDLGASWIEERVIAGQRRITIDDVKAAIVDLDLRAGTPWTTVSVATIKADALADQAAARLDWVDYMDGESEWTRIAPAPPHTWDDLANEVRTLRGAVREGRRILVTGHMRQATGFLIGTEFRGVQGYSVGIRQRDQLWTGEEPTRKDVIEVEELEVGSGADTAIVVVVAADEAEAAVGWARAAPLPVDKALVVRPLAGTGPVAIPTPSEANSLAVAIRDLARRHADADLHLFLIGPLGLAVLLGHHWNRVTTTHVYEHLGGAEYTPAFTVQA